ncbi:DUF1178 family protein [Sphingomonas sp. SUN039]|uniref:DUF1178 family protein n=1 Tax=Sphingomonas sp. SUN039 TaxID=2937787 RepID=UPI00216409DE|nr:DUF1178 family protein [Sphingomonas sp. SUN039]UVO53465.1 DUF1178 family protein [Sphingomonas sp. SUN039]
MIVFDLKCAQGHGFEGWFADSDSFADQRDGGQIPCPYCGSTAVERALSVPRIGAKGNRSEPAELVQKLAGLQAEMLKDSKWVGDDFARQARAMADGDTPQATIHGQATIGQAKELHDDGITVMPLPFAVVPPEQQN